MILEIEVGYVKVCGKDVTFILLDTLDFYSETKKKKILQKFGRDLVIIGNRFNGRVYYEGTNENIKAVKLFGLPNFEKAEIII